MSDSICFKSTAIIIDGFALSNFESNFSVKLTQNFVIQNKTSWNELYADGEYDIILDGINYKFLAIKHGSISDPSPYLQDIQDGSQIPNPRKKTQVEPIYKFLVIDFKYNMIYHNDVSKEFMKKYFSVKTNTAVGKIDFRTDINLEQFLNTISTVENFSFSISDRNLLSGEKKLYKELLDDEYGYGIEKLSVDIKLKSFADSSKKYIRKYSNVIKEVSTIDAKTIRIVGKNEDQLEKIFKTDNYHNQVFINYDNLNHPSKDEMESIVSQLICKMQKV